MKTATQSLPVPLQLHLPWPRLTANKVWVPWANRGRVGLRLRPEAKEYFELVAKTLLVQRVPRHSLAVALDVDLEFFPPTGRRADIDNVAPLVLDALTHAGVWLDDEWVERLTLKRNKASGVVPVVWVSIRSARR